MNSTESSASNDNTRRAGHAPQFTRCATNVDRTRRGNEPVGQHRRTHPARHDARIGGRCGEHRQHTHQLQVGAHRVHDHGHRQRNVLAPVERRCDKPCSHTTAAGVHERKLRQPEREREREREREKQHHNNPNHPENGNKHPRAHPPCTAPDVSNHSTSTPSSIRRCAGTLLHTTRPPNHTCTLLGVPTL